MNWSAAEVALVPPGAVTVTCTVPAAREGRVAVMEVADVTVNRAAFPGPKLTAVAPVKVVPVMTTDVPPEVGPRFGATAVTVGATA